MNSSYKLVQCQVILGSGKTLIYFNPLLTFFLKFDNFQEIWFKKILKIKRIGAKKWKRKKKEVCMYTRPNSYLKNLYRELLSIERFTNQFVGFSRRNICDLVFQW